VYETLFLTSNPTCTKAALNLLGHDVGGLRLPLVEATAERLGRCERCSCATACSVPVVDDSPVPLAGEASHA
jgi:dihydrodipicolinate synthase/N-acetylneuraminate lyase